ncbi:MAG: carboxypeptidase-like regulatory domain-containing protein [Methylobacter sp.]|nr:carboxypeptidase-like regulatory domain-containing protein [Methylobacter sp.]
MKRLYYLLILPCFLFSLYAFADEQLLQPQTQNDVTFVSGGIGESEHNAMLAMKGDYNLNLLFAVKRTGKFIADVNVRIADGKNNTLLETAADGPYLFARLKPGKYMVTAEKDGKVMRQKARVSDRKTTSLIFYWPQEYGN